MAVVIPSFNGMPYLPEAVQSILDQTFRDFRLYIVDDGSQDGSPAFARSVADPRATAMSVAHGGYSRLMNAVGPGLREPLVAVLHQDDVALPERLERQTDLLERRPEYDAVFCQLELIGADGRRLGFRSVGSGADAEDYDPGRYGSLVHTGACFRRDRFVALGGYRTELYPAADYDLLLRMAEQGRVAVINRPLVRYRYHAGANTYKVFRRMALMGRYVRHLHDLRSAGRPEISLEAYRASREHSLPVRWRNYRTETGRYCYRRAAALAGSGRYARGGAFLAAAALCIPLTVAGTLGAYLRRPGTGQDSRRIS